MKGAYFKRHAPTLEILAISRYEPRGTEAIPAIWVNKSQGVSKFWVVLRIKKSGESINGASKCRVRRNIFDFFSH